MATLDEQLQTTQDRITDLLTKRSGAADTGDIGTALFSALAGGKTFGENLNAMKAQRIQQEGALYDILSNRAASRRAERQLDLQERMGEERLSLMQQKFDAELSKNNPTAKAIDQVAKGTSDPNKATAHLLKYFHSRPEKVGEFEILTEGPRILEEAGITSKAAGSSEFEREISDLVASGAMTSEEAQDLRKNRAKTLSQGGQGVSERNMKEYVRLSEKVAAGTATPTERAQLDVIRYQMSRHLAVPDVGVVRVSPPGGPSSLPAPTGAPTPAPSPAAPTLPAAPAQAAPTAQSAAPLAPQTAPANKGGAGTVVVRAKPKPLPQGTQDDLDQLPGMWDAFQHVERGLKETGFVVGPLKREFAKRFGGNQDIIDFDTGFSNMRLAAQALIKGTPSNFDVTTFVETLPQAGLDPDVNKSRLAFTKTNARNLLALKIGYYKGLNYQIPPAIMDLAKKFGIDTNTINAMDETQVKAATDAIIGEGAKVRALGKFGKDNIEGISHFGGRWQAKLKDGSWRAID